MLFRRCRSHRRVQPRPGRIPPVTSSSPSVAPPLDDGIPRRAYEELPAETTTTRLRLPPSAVCPITHAPLQDPLLAADGHSYERRVIVQWLRTHRTSPVTGQVLAHRLLTPNHALRGVIAEIVADAEAA